MSVSASSFDARGLQRVAPQAWLDVIEHDYLESFVRFGGSSVKFISGTQETLATIVADLRQIAVGQGYWFAHLDPDALTDIDPSKKPRKPDYHRMDRFYFGITEALNWRALSSKQARRLLESKGYEFGVREISDVEGVARDLGISPNDVMRDFQKYFAVPQIGDKEMALEFRSAVVALGRAQLSGEIETPTTEEVIIGWLKGMTFPGAANVLKKIGIYDRITQQNARHIMTSFCHWLPSVGFAGTVVVLDFRPYERKRMSAARLREVVQQNRDAALRVAISRGLQGDELLALLEQPTPEPTTVFYSDQAYYSMLALLRHFLDEVGEMQGFFLVVLANDSFFPASEVERRPDRKYQDYSALQSRISQEVHDRSRANPEEVLVHLGGDE